MGLIPKIPFPATFPYLPLNGLAWLDFDPKVDSNTGGGGGREEEGSGEPEEPKISGSVARFVRYRPQATQIPKGSSGN